VVCILIKNFNELIAQGEGSVREKVLKIIEEGLAKANPKEAIKRAITVEKNLLIIGDRQYNLTGKLIIIGGGKAAGLMAEAVEESVGSKIFNGAIIIPRGSGQYRLKQIKVMEGEHPMPSVDNVKATKVMLELVSGLSRNDLVICLISGGASSLITLPVATISLDDLQHTTQLLLRSGASIEEINTVRKHLCAIKGGQLAKAVYPAELIGLIISDVVGDPMDVIASGPTVPDASTFMDSIEILQRYNLWDSIPETVCSRLNAGVKGEIPETPKPGDKIFDHVYNRIVASNSDSLDAMYDKANELSLNSLILTRYMEGEARHVGRFVSSIIREIYYHNNPIKKPAAIIAGGETTVTVTGDGKGGRNQELVLGAALCMRGLKGVAIASIGSDGIDGVCDAAGAIADGQTLTRAKDYGMNPYRYLKNNDSYTFFKTLGDCIFTGRTNTNVNDFTVAIVTDLE